MHIRGLTFYYTHRPPPPRHSNHVTAVCGGGVEGETDLWPLLQPCVAALRVGRVSLFIDLSPASGCRCRWIRRHPSTFVTTDDGLGNVGRWSLGAATWLYSGLRHRRRPCAHPACPSRTRNYAPRLHPPAVAETGAKNSGVNSKHGRRRLERTPSLGTVSKEMKSYSQCWWINVTACLRNAAESNSYSCCAHFANRLRYCYSKLCRIHYAEVPIIAP